MSVYHGTKFGFVQSTVKDQMGISLAGRLANASDINLCDSYTIGETAGVGVGLGVSLSTIAGVKKPGINDTEVKLPASNAAATDFAGILIRTDTGHTDENGKSYVADKEVGVVLRSDRVGGRIWVKAESAITTGGNLYWVVNPSGAASAFEKGGFAGSAVSGATVQLTNVKVVAGASAGELALIEMLG